MPDYGHDVQFGSFVTPSNRDPEAVVDLALLAERVGLDLVSYQDHPYQNGFLDTWTLMSWVAARTTSIRLATNVANVPLRPLPSWPVPPPVSTSSPADASNSAWAPEASVRPSWRWAVRTARSARASARSARP